MKLQEKEDDQFEEDIGKLFITFIISIIFIIILETKYPLKWIEQLKFFNKQSRLKRFFKNLV